MKKLLFALCFLLIASNLYCANSELKWKYSPNRFSWFYTIWGGQYVYETNNKMIIDLANPAKALDTLSELPIYQTDLANNQLIFRDNNRIYRYDYPTKKIDSIDINIPEMEYLKIIFISFDYVILKNGPKSGIEIYNTISGEKIREFNFYNGYPVTDYTITEDNKNIIMRNENNIAIYNFEQDKIIFEKSFENNIYDFLVLNNEAIFIAPIGTPQLIINFKTNDTILNFTDLVINYIFNVSNSDSLVIINKRYLLNIKKPEKTEIIPYFDNAKFYAIINDDLKAFFFNDTLINCFNYSTSQFETVSKVNNILDTALSSSFKNDIVNYDNNSTVLQIDDSTYQIRDYETNSIIDTIIVPQNYYLNELSKQQYILEPYSSNYPYLICDRKSKTINDSVPAFKSDSLTVIDQNINIVLVKNKNNDLVQIIDKKTNELIYQFSGGYYDHFLSNLKSNAIISEYNNHYQVRMLPGGDIVFDNVQPCYNLQVTPGDKFIYYQIQNNSRYVYFYDIEAKSTDSMRIDYKLDNNYNTVVFSSDTKYFAIFNANNYSVNIYDFITKKMLLEVKGFEGYYQAFSISKDFRYLIIQRNGILYRSSICYKLDLSNLDVERQEDINPSFSIYPNPATERISINGLDCYNQNLKVYNIMGEILNTYEIVNSSLEIDISNYPSGTYYIQYENKIQIFIKQ